MLLKKEVGARVENGVGEGVGEAYSICGPSHVRAYHHHHMTATPFDGNNLFPGLHVSRGQHQPPQGASCRLLRDAPYWREGKK